MAFFSFRGQKIAYQLQLNESDKQYAVKDGRVTRTMVFLHGLGADQRQAIDTASRFSGYQTLTLDMPGHGETIIDPSENVGYWFCFQTFCDITLALLDHLKIDKASFGGISMGAGISIQVALKQPERVERLILVRPAWLNCAALPNLSVVKKIGEEIQQGGIKWAENQLGVQKWFQKLELNYPTIAKSIKGLFTRPQALHAAAVLKNLVNDAPFEQLSDLKKIKQPTVVFSNDGDLLHPSNIAEKIAELIPNASCVKLPSRYQQPEEHQNQLTQLTNLFLTSDLSQCRKPVLNLV